MSNILTKDLPDLHLVSPAIPAVPAVAPTPAYDTTTTIYPPIISAWISDRGDRVAGSDEPPLHTAPYFANYWLPVFIVDHAHPTIITIHHPATAGSPGTPAVDAVFELKDNIGWNASAISIDHITGDGQYQFSVDPSVVGVVTGLNDRDTGSDYFEIDYAFLFKGGYYYVLERGAIKNGPHAYTASTAFTVSRIGGRVKYWRDSALVYTSTIHSAAPLIADCSIFFGGDAISNASLDAVVDATFGSNSGGANGILIGTGNGSGSTPAGLGTPAIGSAKTGGLRGFGGDDAAYASGSGFIRVRGVASGALYAGNSSGSFPGVGAGATEGGGVGGTDGVDVQQQTFAFGGGYILGTGAGGGAAASPGGGTGTGAGDSPGMAGFAGDGLVVGRGFLSQLVGAAGQFVGWDNGQLTVGETGTSGGGGGGGGTSGGVVGGPGEGSDSPSSDDTPVPAGSPTNATGGGIIRPAGEGYGYDDLTTEYSVGSGSFVLVGDGDGGDIIIPPFAVARGTIMPAGFALALDSTAATSAGSFTLTGFGANFSYSEAKGTITPLEGYGYDEAFAADISWFAGRLSRYSLFGIAYTTFGPDAWRGFDNELSGYTFEAHAGASLDKEYSGGTLAGTGSAPLTARLTKTHGGHYTLAGYAGASLDKEYSGGTLSATGAAADTGRFDKTFSGYTFIGVAGAILSSEYSGGTLSATGSAPLTGRLDKIFSGYTFAANSGASLNATYSGGTLTATAVVTTLGRLDKTFGGYTFAANAGASLDAMYSGGTLSATGAAPDTGRLDKTFGGYAFLGVGGASLSATYSGGTLSAAGTATLLGRLDKAFSGYSFSGAGSAPISAALDKALRGRYIVLGYAGASLAKEYSGGTLNASAAAGGSGALNATMSGGTLEATASAGLVATFDVIGPALYATPSGIFLGTYSGYTVEATATSEVSVEYEAYSITLLTLENGQLGTAVTRYTTYPFDRIVRFGSKYYGVAADGLYELDGNDFDGQPIVAEVQTMEDDFDRAEKKRFPALFLSGRVGLDLDVSIISSELETDTYEYRLSPADGSTTHRVKFGKGIEANFVAYGFTNVEGEDFAIDALMPEVDTLKRTV